MHAPRSSQRPDAIPVDLLLLAYRNGIFPMADSREDQEVFWVEPRERAIIPIGGFHCSRSLARVIRQERFKVTVDQDFEGVVRACAAPRPGHPESWISERIVASYRQLFAAGHAHSIECWQDGELVGGVYGVAFDRVFCGESMFSRRRDASKVALGWLLALLERAGCVLFDCQFMTGHLASLGAIEIPQKRYLELLDAARGTQPLTLPEAYSAVVDVAEGDADGVADGDGSGAAGAASPGYRIAQSLTHTS
ncbi:leucyl/phenylalanyl-tRNA--protein transferase [Erythrobacter sp. SDW2]|uniref:leucyl/phenylalanyl-tRNA--protein transferase n=1 Tax=Erythrobacter sp. SDW2 TaxID=2907154 RepID=UPI001F42EAB0|nr:leucyl/phenylalanyl-tRNA--protein transferase [Erythrobacter sp. SDW2]UIP07663.1 leucyl/phenylalanyl-tRNA--protein transferase [Erythrobacter sp. SDW2]